MTQRQAFSTDQATGQLIVTAIPAGGPPKNATLIRIVGSTLLSATLTTDQVVYTVSPGKTLYITEIYLSFSGGTGVVLTWTAGGITILTHYFASGSPIAMSGMVSFAGIPAGTAIHLTAPIATANTVYYNIYGYEA